MSKRNQDDITAWLDNAGRFDVLPAESVTLIAREIQSLPGDSSRRRYLINKLVSHNLKLVARYVKAFMDGRSHNKWGSTETVDYLQVGTIGLMRAAEMYDPTRGYAFSTYANHWIRSAVGRYNLKTLTPVHVSESAARQLVFYKSNGYFPLKSAHGVLPPDRAKRLMRDLYAAYGYVSIDAESDAHGCIKDFLSDKRNPDDIDYSGQRLTGALEEAGVSPLGQQILVGYFVDNKPNKELAASLGVSPETLKREKRVALEQARQAPQAFLSRYDDLVLSP